MAKILRKVGERLSWNRLFGIFNFSFRREMDEALREAFRNKPF